MDFSPSGVYGLPVTTLDAITRGGDPRVLGWLREAVQEGEYLNRSDPSWDQMEKGMAYVSGIQAPTAMGGVGGPSYLPNLQINESRRTMQAHVSALTDLQPVFSYKSMNPAFNQQGDLLNKLTIAWWITTMADLELGNCIKYALAAGTGDLVTEWNPKTRMGGDVQISARDARDTLPIRPGVSSVNSIQDWEGLILREGHTVNSMRGLFPEYADRFRPSTDSLLSTLMGKFRTMMSRLATPSADTLSGLSQPAQANRRGRYGDLILYRIWLNDQTKNLTGKPIPMGKPGTSWAYIVPPGGYLYPHKRMILSTPEMILYDGPSTYWHGQFPVSRLKLWSLPWHFLGLSLFNDLLPVQDGINHLMQGFLLGIDKWLNPAVAYNRRAVSENFMRVFDPRKPGAKVKLNDDGIKEGFKVLDGPPPQMLQIALEAYQTLVNKFDDLSGTPNMQQLLAFRQMPGADTIDRWWEAVTPEIRQEGRQMEAFLRDVAEQAKVIRFQYESNARRVQILGDAGLALQDFDFDPGNLVPAMQVGEPGYQPEFDKALPRDDRAKAFHKTIIFTIAPNSILAMNSTEGKMMRMQLSRMGMYDFWSLAEALDIPNVGVPPKIPLPPINPEQAQSEINQAMLTPGGLQSIASKYILDPMSGQLLEIREPITVTERLMAQQQLGIGMAESPAGRKASGQAAPRMEEKSDGRTTVTESRHEKGKNSD
jgi:hypothetical protein